MQRPVGFADMQQASCQLFGGGGAEHAVFSALEREDEVLALYRRPKGVWAPSMMVRRVLQIHCRAAAPVTASACRATLLVSPLEFSCSRK